MNDFLQLAGTASALGDPSRLAMCMSLMDGHAKTAGELARAAGVAPSTASEHLARLVDSGIVSAETHRRHRYYQIATPRVAEMIESLGEVAMGKPSLRSVSPNVPLRLRVARTCYDHLAGHVAVGICKALEAAQIIARDGAEYRLTPTGAVWSKEAGLEIERGRSTRALARFCLDWSERQPHVGGLLGAAILRRLVDARLAVRGNGREMTMASLERVLDGLSLRAVAAPPRFDARITEP
jgi:DNA-binding transcriptional ArsR family regulator